MYYVVQVLTLLVLILAANTSFQGFPRLSALLARDRFVAAPVHEPRRPARLLERDASCSRRSPGCCSGSTARTSNNLIHLYVIGVFTAFTLSQAGMVRYWLRTRGPGWRAGALVNGVGATATGVVTLVVIYTKFAEGAWLVIVAIPLLVLGMLGISRHYDASRAAAARRCGGRRRGAAGAQHDACSSSSRSTRRPSARSWFARAISRERLPRRARPARGTDPASAPRWFHLAGGEPQLEVLDRRLGAAEAVLEQVWRLPRGESDFVTVVVPELFDARSLARAGATPASSSR